LFTSALGLVPPWQVEKVDLDTTLRRIDFEVRCSAKRLSCPHCGAAEQPVHDRLRRSWRHLDFFQFEAWLHADVPRVACTGCGKTCQASVPWAREGSGFTALFEALALALCKELPVLQAAKRAARGYRTASNFIAIAYLRMSKRKHLPAHPFAPALAK
jgi:transposase